jgi:hypothetical protein
MQALAYQNGTVRAAQAVLEAEGGPYCPHHAGDSLSPPKERTCSETIAAFRQRLAGPARVSAPIVVPSLLLATLLGAAYLYADAVLLLAHAPGAVIRAEPTIGDLIVPMAWFSIHLTNRRLGTRHAFLQLAAGVLLAAFLALASSWSAASWSGSTPALSLRALLAFAPAFLLASMVAIAAFDAMRGPSWWKAPLSASFMAALVFSVFYYPVAFAGGAQVAWVNSALVHLVLFAGESVLLLAPYWLLRPAMRPMGGLNGY